MSLFLKYLVVAITGICYLCATFELSESERKENYEKEVHIYAHVDKDFRDIVPKAVVTPHIFETIICSCFGGSLQIPVSGACFAQVEFSIKATSPPHYLRNCVFLI